MKPAGNMFGSGEFVRRFRIGETCTEGQIVIADSYASAGSVAEVSDPISVNDYGRAVGITLEAGTYSTTQGTGANSAEVMVKVSYSPFQLFRGTISGGTAADTAFTGAVILTEPTGEVAGLVLADTDVATLDYVDGYLVGLTGNNKGAVRVISTQNDNTSLAVTVPFDQDIAVGDTYIRTYAPFLDSPSGPELTTNFEQFNGLIAAGETILDDLGDCAFWDILFDGSSPSHGSVNIINETAPVVEGIAYFTDHVINPL